MKKATLISRVLCISQTADAMALFAILFMGAAMLPLFAPAHMALAADNPRQSYQQPVPIATPGMQAAEQDLKTAGTQFTRPEPLPLVPAGNTQSAGADPKAAQDNKNRKNKAKPLFQVPKEPVLSGTRTDIPPAATAGLLGSPDTGFAGTWTDPANGDVITSVIAPTPPASTQSYPVYVEPHINGAGWNGTSWDSGPWGSSSWNNNWNNGWQSNGAPQWPGYPGDPGYMPPPPPPSQVPVIPPYATGQPPYLPPTPGLNMPSYPPPRHPGYRPLRPGNGNPPPPPPGQGWNSGAVPPPGAGWQQNPGLPPNHGFRPPSQFQPNPGFQPGGNQGFRPLPMRPGGTTWGSSPFSNRPGGPGMFGRGGN